MAESQGSPKLSPKQETHMCDICLPDRQMMALAICRDCTQYLCSNCCDSHSRITATRKHKLIIGGKLPRLKRIMATLFGSNDSIDETQHHVCDACKDNNRELEAPYFCKNCVSYLCPACQTAHVTNEDTKHHRIFTGKEMKKVAKLTQTVIAKKTLSAHLFKNGRNNMSFDNPQRKSKGRLVGEFNIRTERDEKECNVTGMCRLSGSRIAITDHYNKKVKLIDLDTFKVISETSMIAKPWDVTIVSETSIAVTLPKAKVIQYISVLDTELTIGETIETEAECYGIVFNDDLNEFIIGCIDPSMVQLIDRQGNIKDTIGKSGLSSIFSLFSWPNYVTLSRDKTVMYISDCDKYCVYGLSMEGDLKFMYKYNECPLGMSTDGDGNILVADLMANKVLLLSANGEKIRTIVKKEINQPMNVLYDEQRNWVIVTMRSSDIVKIFEGP